MAYPVLISAIYIIVFIIFNPYGCSYNYILPLLVWRQINDYLFIIYLFIILML